MCYDYKVHIFFYDAIDLCISNVYLFNANLFLCAGAVRKPLMPLLGNEVAMLQNSGQCFYSPLMALTATAPKRLWDKITGVLC